MNTGTMATARATSTTMSRGESKAGLEDCAGWGTVAPPVFSRAETDSAALRGRFLDGIPARYASSACVPGFEPTPTPGPGSPPPDCTGCADGDASSHSPKSPGSVSGSTFVICAGD